MGAVGAGWWAWVPDFFLAAAAARFSAAASTHVSQIVPSAAVVSEAPRARGPAGEGTSTNVVGGGGATFFSSAAVAVAVVTIVLPGLDYQPLVRAVTLRDPAAAGADPSAPTNRTS